jgi:hypothetical protein
MSDPETELRQIHALRNRSEVVRKNVDFHLVYGQEVWASLWDSKGLLLMHTISQNIYALRVLGLYPVNTLRNEAVLKCRTGHVMVLDVDFIPSRDARRNILYSPCRKQAIVRDTSD